MEVDYHIFLINLVYRKIYFWYTWCIKWYTWYIKLLNLIYLLYLNFTIKQLGGVEEGVRDLHRWFFQKCVFWREGEPYFFVTFNIIIPHIFPESMKVLSVNISYSHRFSDFLTFPYYKETNDLSLWQIMSAFFNPNIL